MTEIGSMIYILGSCKFYTLLTALFVLNAGRGYCANNTEFRNRGRQSSRPKPQDKFFSALPTFINSADTGVKYQPYSGNIEPPSYSFEIPQQAFQGPRKPTFQAARPQQIYQTPQQSFAPVRPFSQTRTIEKWFRSHSLTDAGGTVTTLWFYQNNGRSYKFTVNGPLPAAENQMIDWIERNSHNYPLTDITYVPYGGDTSQSLSPAPAPVPPPPQQFRPPARPQLPPQQQQQPTDYRPVQQPEYRPPQQSEYRPAQQQPGPVPNAYQQYRPPTQPAYQPQQPEYPPQQVFLPTSQSEFRPQPIQPQPESRPRPSRPVVSESNVRPNRPEASDSTSSGTPWDGDWPLKSCGKVRVKFDDKIVGGNETTIQRNPWQVAIVEKGSLNLICGGTLITNRHIVSAAHCFVQANRVLSRNDIRILAGYTDIQPKNKKFHDVQDVFVHSSYEKEHKRNDVSLIFLKNALKFSASIYPICVPKKVTADYKTGRKCRITGWGKTNADAGSAAQILQSLTLPITNEAQCKAYNEQDHKITEGMFCAGDYYEGGKDSCQGDSGGPLVCYDEDAYYLYGITSWGYGCGQKYYPGVYTKVTVYRSWIEHYLRLTKKTLNKDAFHEPEPDPDYDELDEHDDENWEQDVL